MADAKKQIVAQDFFCIKTKKSWKKGQEYTGGRKDIAHVLKEIIQAVKKEVKKETKELKTTPKTKK